MTNCTRCGSEIPIKEIVAGNYKKVDGSPYCLSCAALEPAKKAEAVKPAVVASAATPAARPRAATPPPSAPVAPVRGSGPSRAKATTSRGASPKASASSASLRKPAPARRAAEDDTENEENAPRRGYVKKEDPTLKIAAIVGAVGLSIALAVFFYTFSNKKAEDRAREEKIQNSRNAIAEIRKFLTERTDDASNDELEATIKRNAPLVIDSHLPELNGFRLQLEERRSLAAKRKKFNELFAFVSNTIKDPSKATEVEKAIAEIDKLIVAVGSDAQQKDLAAFKVLNAVALLEAKYNKAVEVREKNPDNYPLICEAFTIAEEQMSDQVQQLLKSNVPGTERAKELYTTVVGQVNTAAEQWASSDKYGFAAIPGRNLLDPSEFAKGADGSGSRWFAGNGADYRLDGKVLVMKGVGSTGEGRDLRAGVVAWAPGGNQMAVVPGTKDVIRNYELTLRFKVIRKGFTLLARHTKGYQRHSYSFETAQAQEEIRAQSKKIAASGQVQGGIPAADPFGVEAMPANVESGVAFVIEDGKSYEVVEEVHGNTVRIRAKAVGASDQPDPIEELVRARYGGIAFQLLPGAEVAFDVVSIKILN